MEENKNKSVVNRVMEAVLIVFITFVIYGTLANGVVHASQFSYDFCYKVFGDESMQPSPGVDMNFVVKSGESMNGVAVDLDKMGLIHDQYTFLVRTRLMDPKKTVLHPGTYILNTKMNYKEIINTLTVSG